MKATGEVMAIERNLEAALQKAVDSLELDNIGTFLPEFEGLASGELIERMKKTDDRRFFAVMELIRRGLAIEEIHRMTEMDLYFLSCFKHIVDLEQQLKKKTISTLDADLFASVKEKGFSDRTIASLIQAPEADVRKLRLEVGIKASYKYVDTCAAEFEARTNYFYST
jgi:carbamoyl-phosphate synthase large subunit